MTTTSMFVVPADKASNNIVSVRKENITMGV